MTRPPHWRHTQRSKIDVGVAAVAGLAALVLLVTGVAKYRRMEALRSGAEDVHRLGDASIRGLADGLDAHPEEPALLILRAMVLADRGDHERAQIDLGRAARSPSGAGEIELRALAWAGSAAVGLESVRAGTAPDARFLDEVEKRISQASSLGARSPEARILRGALHLERGDVDQAIRAFEEAAAAAEPPARGGLVTLYAGLAEARLRKGDAKAGAALLQQAVLLAPAGKLRTALVERLARAIARRTVDPELLPGEPRKTAIESARAALRKIERRESETKLPLYRLESAHSAEIRRAIGIAEARDGQLEPARASLEQALMEAPKDPADRRGIDTLRGRISRDLGAVLLALHDVEKREDPRRTLARKAAEALREASSGLGATPPRELHAILVAAGSLFARAGLFDAALLELRRAEAIDGSDPGLLRALAITLDIAGRRSEAIAGYERAVAAAAPAGGAPDLEGRLEALKKKVGGPR